MENKTYGSASKYVDQMIDLHGTNYSILRQKILDNCVNSSYSRSSNEFITYVWQILNEKYKS